MRLELSIPITMLWKAVFDGKEEAVEYDNVLSSLEEVKVEFTCGKKVYNLDMSISGNMIILVDNGTLPVGTYDITIKFKDQGVVARYKQKTILIIVDETARGGYYDTDEFNVMSVYPIIKGRTTAIIVGDDDVIINERGGFQGDETPNDDYADIAASYGDGSIEVSENNVTLHI